MCDTAICESKQVSKTVLHRSANMGLKLLNTEWIIQSLIHAQQLENYRNYWYKKS